MSFKINNSDDPIIYYYGENVYSPSDDTFLILDYFKEAVTDFSFDGHNIKKIHYLLDMGTGSGIIAIFLKSLANKLVNFNPKIYASDILKEAIKCAKKNVRLNNLNGKIHFIYSNLFQSFPKKVQHKFNVIIFNPPYLPSIDANNGQTFSYKDYCWKGGKDGHEILLEFLNDVLFYFAPEHNAVNLLYFITSSRINKGIITERLNYLGFKTENLVKTHFFFEDIILNRAIRIVH